MEEDTVSQGKKRKADESINNAEDEFSGAQENLEWINELSIKELKDICDERGISVKDIAEKPDLIKRVKDKLHKDFLEGIPYKRKKLGQRRDCPYLDTINRTLLDFDFEKVCSVTLQNLNVYACLVCGKYFQGRGRNSQAYLHSLQANHHVFINLHSEKVYCLPDDYEVIDPSLADIKFYLNPKFTPDVVAKLDSTNKKVSQALDGTEYLPGFVGLNNIKNTDYVNVTLQSLSHVQPLRNFFLIEKNYTEKTEAPLVLRFGELVRKMFNPKNFKAHVSPHEVLQAISTASNKKFHIGQKGDPLELTIFLLNHIHLALGGTKKPGSSIIHQIFQGHLEIYSAETLKDLEDRAPEKMERAPFLYLTLDIPPPPLFKDESEKNIIPQVPIFDLLTKYDSRTTTYVVVGGKNIARRYAIKKLPPYVIIHLKRFTRNNFFLEKNPTIVNFPLKSLDLGEYLETPSPAKYNLITNITYEGEPEKGFYKAHVLDKATDQWYEMQDLMVKQILPQLIPLSESYVQIWELQKE